MAAGSPRHWRCLPCTAAAGSAGVSTSRRRRPGPTAEPFPSPSASACHRQCTRTGSLRPPRGREAPRPGARRGTPACGCTMVGVGARARPHPDPDPEPYRALTAGQAWARTLDASWRKSGKSVRSLHVHLTRHCATAVERVKCKFEGIGVSVIVSVGVLLRGCASGVGAEARALVLGSKSATYGGME